MFKLKITHQNCLVYFITFLSIYIWYSNEESTSKIFSFLNPDQKSNLKLECKLPIANAKGHFKTFKEIKCKAPRKALGYLENGVWKILQHYKGRSFKIVCKYRQVVQNSKTDKSDNEIWKILFDGQEILDDVIEVKCKRNLQSPFEYQSIFYHIANKLNGSNFKRTSNSNCRPLDVILLSYESVSKIAWLKRLPKTSKLMFEIMKFKLLHGYSVTQRESTTNLIQLMSGKTEQELANNDVLNPFILNDLHTNNYVSVFVHDYFNGISNISKEFYNQAETCNHLFKIMNEYCIGGKKRHQIVLNLILDFKKKYMHSTNNIAIVHYDSGLNQKIEKLNWFDDDLYSFFSTGYYEGYFDNTAIILYSNQGSKFLKKRLSKEQILEKKLPVAAIYLPEEFTTNKPNSYNNLITNSGILTSAFDIHSTIRDLTCLSPTQNIKNLPTRSISLLDKIPLSRTCHHIGIPEHYCICDK